MLKVKKKCRDQRVNALAGVSVVINNGNSLHLWTANLWNQTEGMSNGVKECVCKYYIGYCRRSRTNWCCRFGVARFSATLTLTSSWNMAAIMTPGHLCNCGHRLAEQGLEDGVSAQCRLITDLCVIGLWQFAEVYIAVTEQYAAGTNIRVEPKHSAPKWWRPNGGTQMVVAPKQRCPYVTYPCQYCPLSVVSFNEVKVNSRSYK